MAIRDAETIQAIRPEVGVVAEQAAQSVQVAQFRSKKRLFNVQEYYRMAEVGILRPDERVELINGEIIQMSPIGSRHGGCVNALNALLGEIKGRIAIVSIQNPLDVDGYSEPEPDVALLRFRPDHYRESHPTPADVLLLAEVSDSTIAADRRDKVPLYARVGIPVLWIIDVQKDYIEVYSNPSEGQYGKFERIQPGQSLAVPGIAGAALSVDDILGLSGA